MRRMSPKPRVVTSAVAAPRRVSSALVPRVVPSRTATGGILAANGRPNKRRMANSGASSPLTSS